MTHSTNFRKKTKLLFQQIFDVALVHGGEHGCDGVEGLLLLSAAAVALHLQNVGLLINVTKFWTQ